MRHKTPKVSSIEKSLNILMAFTPNSSEMRTLEISRKTGFHTATVNRTLQVLTRKRFLQQNPLTRKFTLGPSILSLGQATMESLSDGLVRVAMPHLGELSEKLGETVVLEVISGTSGTIAYVVQGKRALNIRASIGWRVPTHAAAGAKAIIAFSETEIIDGFAKKKLRRFTKNTITDPEKLRRHLEEVQRKGVAFTREEIDAGINAIGVPILNHENRPVAAVVIVGPSLRIRCDLKSPIVAEIRKTASNIPAQLFHSGSMGDMG